MAALSILGKSVVSGLSWLAMASTLNIVTLVFVSLNFFLGVAFLKTHASGWLVFLLVALSIIQYAVIHLVIERDAHRRWPFVDPDLRYVKAAFKEETGDEARR